MMRDSIKKLLLLFDKQEKRKLLFLFFLMIIAALFETIGIGLIVPFVGIVTDPGMIDTQPILSYFYVKMNFGSTQVFTVFAVVVLLLVFVLKNIYLLFLIMLK